MSCKARCAASRHGEATRKDACACHSTRHEPREYHFDQIFILISQGIQLQRAKYSRKVSELSFESAFSAELAGAVHVSPAPSRIQRELRHTIQP